MYFLYSGVISIISDIILKNFKIPIKHPGKLPGRNRDIEPLDESRKYINQTIFNERIPDEAMVP